VGIGTTSPNEQLEITQNFRLADQQTADDSLNGISYKGANIFIHNFRHATGDTARPDGNNLFVGENTGNLTMGSTATETYHGSYNTGIGKLSLNSNTTGYKNSAVGMYSLYSNTTGYHNSAVGLFSLYSNTTGSFNSAVGNYSLRSNTTGYNNSALGLSSLRSNTTGYYNSAVGYNSGRYITDF